MTELSDAASQRAPARPPLRRASGTPVAGVSLGLSRHLGLSVPLIRLSFILLTIFGGLGLVLYCWLWVFVPAEAEPTAAAARRGLSGPAISGAEVVTPPAAPSSGRAPASDNALSSAPAGVDPSSAAAVSAQPATGSGRGKISPAAQRGLDALTSSPEVLLGGVLLSFAALLLAQILGFSIDWRVVVVPAVILGGVILAWSQLDRANTGWGREKSGYPGVALGQIAAGTALVLLAMLIIAAGLVGAGELIAGTIVGAILLAGVALVLAPWGIKLYRTSQVARARAAAEAERADIAAHLHDSVLQTLAMIQKQKADPQAVEQLARSQERQLRSWLYRPDAQNTESLKDQVLAVATELEELHAVPVEVISVGDSRAKESEPLIAATREAILNAMKHAGPVSVYLESTQEQDAVFIRDRGAGFDIAQIEDDRMGIRESIMGRMRRAGGTATIRSGAAGTEIQLTLPVAEHQNHPAANEYRGPAAASEHQNAQASSKETA